jgi:hypothetical protein
MVNAHFCQALREQRLDNHLSAFAIGGGDNTGTFTLWLKAQTMMETNGHNSLTRVSESDFRRSASALPATALTTVPDKMLLKNGLGRRVSHPSC